jgi:hypothetical protein
MRGITAVVSLSKTKVKDWKKGVSGMRRRMLLLPSAGTITVRAMEAKGIEVKGSGMLKPGRRCCTSPQKTNSRDGRPIL